MPSTSSVAAISEIFSSLQGEGTHIGERHLFLRFESCNIHCDYCDELGKPGYGYDVESVVETVKGLDREFGPHRYISLTGGEPLLYLSFLKQLAPRLGAEQFKLYLETNGILWQALRDVIHFTDVVAMDVKPASVTKERSFIKEHARFLEIAVRRETFIKMVCSKEIDTEEFCDLCRMIASKRRTVPLILQPVTADTEGHEDRDLMHLLGKLQQLAFSFLEDVRIIPRLHKILKIR